MLYLSFLLLLLVPFLLSGTFNYLSIFIVFVSILLFFVASRFNRGIQRTIPNISFIVFSLSLLILLPFSMLFIRSIPIIIWWLGYLGIFLLCQCLVKTENILENISKMFVAITTVFGIVSIYDFIKIGLTSYTRLNGFFDSHNVYGGFLIIPFFLSFYFIFKEQNRWLKIGWLFSSSIIFSSIILTFSRGTWVSIVMATLIVMISIGLSKFSFFNKKNIIFTFTVLITTALMTMGVWYLAKQTTIQNDSNSLASVSVFSQQNFEENAFTARLFYFKDAWQTILQSPVIGFGPGLYANALRMYKVDPNHGSFADPHNWLLKMLVENGFIVTTIFVVFIISLFWQMRKLIFKQKDNSWLAVVILAGLIGSIIHGLMDFDWSFSLLMVIFFLFAGSLYGFLLSNSEQSRETVSYFPNWISYILVFLVLAGVIISIQTLRADLARARGDLYFLQVNDSDTAIDSYFESTLINSYEPLTYYDLWRVYYNDNKYGAAKNCIMKAIALMPQNGIYYGALARTEQYLGESDNYRESLLKAIKYFPASDLDYYVMLVDFDIKQKKYDEALAVISSVLPVYEKYQKALWYKTDPNFPVIDENLKKLKEFKTEIEKEIGLISTSTK